MQTPLQIISELQTSAPCSGPSTGYALSQVVTMVTLVIYHACTHETLQYSLCVPACSGTSNQVLLLSEKCLVIN